MALADHPTFKKAAARTSSSRPTRSVTHSSRPSRAPRSSTSGGGGGRAPSSKPAKKPASSAPAKKAPARTAVKKTVLRATPEGRAIEHVAPKLAQPKAKRAELPAGGLLTRSNPRRLLLAEYLVCMTVLGTATVVSPQGANGGVPRLVVRGSAFSALFMVLALISSAGRQAERVAAGLGGLVTVSYVVTSKDGVNLFTWMSGFFSRQGTGASPGASSAPAPQSSGAIGEAGLILESALSPDHASALNDYNHAVGGAGTALAAALGGVFAKAGGSDIAGGAADSTNVGPPDQVTNGGATAE